MKNHNKIGILWSGGNVQLANINRQNFIDFFGFW